MKVSETGEFIRGRTEFRDRIKADGTTSFSPERDRYHLYVSLACPWAHRTLIMRKLKGLEEVISVSSVDPLWNDQGWTFSGESSFFTDTVNHKRDLIDIYRLANPLFSNEETVPVLWDKKTHTIVNNESLEIIRMFDVELDSICQNSTSYYPVEHQDLIDETINKLYPSVNNGVYRSGFATTQHAYENAVNELFSALDHWESVLKNQPYLCGNTLTEADICFYTTLIRFDSVYYSHFKCNLRQISDYPSLWRYLKRLFHTPGFGDTTDFNHIKRHYYGCHRALNPTGIIPIGPQISFEE